MRARGGEDAEFSAFVAHQSDRLYRSAYLLTTSAPAAEDLLQNTFAKVFTHWRRLRRADDPVAYAHRVLINTFLSERRLRRNSELPSPDPLEHGRSTGEEADRPSDVADRVALMSALAELGPLDRAVVVLRFWHDQSVATTAAHLNLTESAVKNRTGRALRQLRDLLDDDLDLPRSTS